MRVATGSAGGWRGRPVYAMDEVAGLLWRERLVVVLVFAILLALGAGLALSLPRIYTAHASLLVNLGHEYVYEPKLGDAARGSAPQKDEVVQSEAEILGSDALKRRVILMLGAGRIAPPGAPIPEKAALKALQRNLSVSTTPESGVVRLYYRDRDPQTAALILNTVVEAYLKYRKEIFDDISSPALNAEKVLTEKRLATADAAFEAFLKESAVADFPSEKAALAAAYQSEFDEKLKTEAQLRQAQGQLAGLESHIGDAPGEIPLQRDLDLSVPTQILKLKADRQSLLGRYLPDAQPVRDVDAQIAQLEALVTSGQGVGEKDRRLGANPVRQQVEAARITAAADVRALRDRSAELERQLVELKGRQMRLTELESRYQSLASDREALQANVRAFAVRSAQDRAAAELGRGGDDNIRIIESAAPPADGKSLRRVAFGAAFLFAAFTALCFGLARVFMRRGFPTAASAERTLELPVLAVAPLKA